MPVAFFQVKLSVKPKTGGEAELVPPEVIKDVHWQFVIVKEGGSEGIIRVEEPAAALRKIRADRDCKGLTKAQMKTLQGSYPMPKLKEKYRVRTDAGALDERFEVDNGGNRIIDTIQTVRSGYYLIDVPVVQP